MLKFLIKLFAVFVFLIPLFFFVAKGSNPQPASAVLEGQCNDGADNDFDGLIDARDPDCTSSSDPSEGSLTYASCNITYSGPLSIYSGESPKVTLSNLEPTHFYFITVATMTNPGIPTYVSSSFRGDTDPKIFTIPSSAFPNSGNTYYIKAFDITNTSLPCRYPIKISVTSPPPPATTECKFDFEPKTASSAETVSVMVTITNMDTSYYYTAEASRFSGSRLPIAKSEIVRGTTGPYIVWITPFVTPDDGTDIIIKVKEESIIPVGALYCRAFNTALLKVSSPDGGLTDSEPVSGKNPCQDFDGDGYIECKTALGTLSPTTRAFVQRILEIGIGLAGGIALIIMVIGAIRFLTSAGDPKAVGAGREMIIAALVGLLFLIFSVIILKFVTTGLGFNWNFPAL